MNYLQQIENTLIRLTSPKEETVLEEVYRLFSTEISYIVGLEANGKMTSDEAYQKIKAAWKKLKSTKKALKNNAS